MDPYLRFVYYMLINNGKIPSGDFRAYMVAYELRQKFATVNVKKYAIEALKMHIVKQEIEEFYLNDELFLRGV